MKFKKNITVSLAFLLILSTFAGCRKINGDMSSRNTSDLTSTAYGIVDIVENNNSELESIDSELASSDVQSTVSDNSGSSSLNFDNSNSNTTSSDIFTENVVSVGDGDNQADPDAPLTFIDSESGSSTVTDTTKGYDNITCSTSPDAKTGNVVTVLIAANGSVTYKIDRVVNKILTINSPNAYVIYDGTKYEAKNGVVSFVVVADHKLSRDQITFEIGNSSSKPESFTINFASPSGTWDNKKVITDIGKEISVTLDAGDEDGYWYKFVPTKSGTFKFYLLSGTDTGILMVTNNRNSAQRSSEIEDELKSDSTGVYLELQVEKGDEIVINVGARKSDTKTTLTIMIK